MYRASAAKRHFATPSDHQWLIPSMHTNVNHIKFRREESVKSIKDSSVIKKGRAINPLSLAATVIDHPRTNHAAASQPLTGFDSICFAKFLGTPADHYDSDSVMANTDRHQPSIPHAYVTEPKAGQLREEILGKRQVYCHFLWLRFNR